MGNGNELSTEVKLAIVQAQTLVDETKKKQNGQAKGLDLTCRFQLRDDYKAIESYIKKVKQGKAKGDVVTELNTLMIRLKTSADGILK